VSKKRFTEGMESLFREMDQDDSQKESPLLVETKVVDKEEESSKPKRPRSSSPGKSFASELEDIFKETLEEKIEERRQSEEDSLKSKKKAKRKKRRPKPADGLDALIRRTIETSQLEVNYEARKRLVLTLEKEKLEKLKAIAKQEKTYLKDIIGRIVEEFLDEYQGK
jgi:hypothetical protein